MTDREFDKRWAAASLQVERAVGPANILAAVVALCRSRGWVLRRGWVRRPLFRVGSHIIRGPRKRVL